MHGILQNLATESSVNRTGPAVLYMDLCTLALHLSQRCTQGAGLDAHGGMQFGPSGKHSAALAGMFGWLRPNKAAHSKDKKRILVLMSMTGGGHKASAEAIEAGFKQLYGDKYHFDIVDAWAEHTPAPFNRLPDTYSFLVKNPILWRVAYQTMQV